MIGTLPLLLRFAPAVVVSDVLGRLDTGQHCELLGRARPLPLVVEHVLADGSRADRMALAQNPMADRALLERLLEFGDYEIDRAVYGHPRCTSGAMRRAVAPSAEAGPMSTQELVGLLRPHTRVRHALRIVDRPHVLDTGVLVDEHRRRPLPPGAVEALLLNGECPRGVLLELLDTRGVERLNRWWYRPAVRAVRIGALSPADVVGRIAPDHRRSLLEHGSHPQVRGGLRWNAVELAAVRREIERLEGRATPPDPALTDRQAVDPGARERALQSVACLDRRCAGWSQHLHQVRDDLRAGVLSGEDVVLRGAPARLALNENAWLGHLDRFDLPEAVAAAHACAGARARAALADDPDRWWRACSELPVFTDSFPALLARV